MQSAANSDLEKRRRELVQRLLTKKFGPLPADVIATLDAVTPEGLEQVANRFRDPWQVSGIGLVMGYIIEVLSIDQADQFRQRLAQLAPTAETAMQRAADAYIEQGQRKLVVRLLTKKFGPLPDDAVLRLDAATPEELEQVADRLLDAQHLDDVFEA
jgi:hypothetical protein